MSSSPNGTTYNRCANTAYKYDKNGNIVLLSRRSFKPDNTIALMDSLVYQYTKANNKLINNRLNYVDDLQTNAALFSEDIDDQTTANYTYDAVGQLIKDNAENIDSIRWNVYGKISNIFYKGGKPSISFQYDATGNRVAKLLTNAKMPVVLGKDTVYAATYYWRDAQGNILATESRRNYALPGATTSSISHTTEVEYNIYGSSRLGTLQDTIAYDVTTLNPYGTYVQYLARRQYELSNHLGNVMATFSDVKTYTGGSYTAKVLSAQNYYPFGMQMPNKNYNLPSYSSLNKYRYGFNGKEMDNETYGNGNEYDYGFRIYNSRLGKFLSIDPLTQSYPWYTPYQFAGNKPIIAIDLDGMEEKIVIYNNLANGGMMTTIIDGKNLYYSTQQSGSFAMGRSMTKEEWLNFKKSYWLGFSKMKNNFTSGYGSYTMGESGKSNTSFDGPNQGTLTISSGNNSNTLIFDPTPVKTTQYSVKESVKLGWYGFKTLFIKPSSLTEGSSEFKETIDNVAAAAGLCVGLGELTEGVSMLKVLGIASNADDLTKLSEKISDPIIKGLIDHMKMAVNIVNAKNGSNDLMSATKDVTNKLPTAIGAASDASSVLNQLSKDIQSLDDSIKKKENNNSDSNK